MEFHLIEAKHNCPFTISVEDISKENSHFHNKLELFLILRGEMTYVLSGTQYHLGEKDFIFSNPYEIHSIRQASADCKVVLIKIDLSSFKKLLSSEESIYFQWEETDNNRSSEQYKKIVDCIRKILTFATNQESAFLAYIYQNILEILILLLKNHHTSAKNKLSSQKLQQTKKSSEIMEYLNEHYMEPITLNTVAKNLYLSAPYVSKIFKDSFHVGFLEYLNHLRIQKSLYSVGYTNEYILDIAIANGFNNTKTFSRIFRQEMGMTPTEYRRLHIGQEFHAEKYEQLSEPSERHILNFLANDNAAQMGTDMDIIVLNQDLRKIKGRKKEKNWNSILSIGTAALLLQQRVQREILQTAKELGAQYIRFTGILSDGIQIYQEDIDGTPHYFWVLLDEILDFIVENQLTPFICLGFMPEKLASRRVPSPYRWNANTSMPKSMELWNQYLLAVLCHCIDRYGYTQVCSWKFEFWNSPSLNGIFWHDSDEDFLYFFQNSYETFRKVLPDGLFGSPGFVYFNNFDWARSFLEFCKDRQIKLDFLCLHSFMLTDPANKDIQTEIYQLNLEKNNNHYMDYLNYSTRQLCRILSELHYQAPIVITEWNISPYYHDLSRDTCFMSAYIVHTLNTLSEQIDQISFWALTDYLEEHIPYQDLFTGELGLKTHNGLPKPAYLAFILLNRMGTNLVSSGNGYWITSKENSYQILLYNYVFYDKDFLNGKSHKLSINDRYQIFAPAKAKKYNIHLTLPAGTYRIERHSLNREHGCVYDSWIRMGSPEYIDDAILNYLTTKAYPDITIQTCKITEQFLLNDIIPVHGIMMIELTRVSD